jgi:hypothetical protein
MTVIRRAAIIFTHYSTVFFINCFFIFGANQALILSVGSPPSGCGMLHYILDAQLFTQPQLELHREHATSVITISFALNSYLTENTALSNEGNLRINHSITPSKFI